MIFHGSNLFITANFYVMSRDSIVGMATSWFAPGSDKVGFVVEKLASGQVFSEYFGFPCQNRSFHQLLHPHNHPEQVQ
jgi:hypothetical protein